jgi:hypothetical protein
MSGDTRSVDHGQIRLVGDTLLPDIATFQTDAEEGLRGTRGSWEEPFVGLPLYDPIGDAWADLCVAFGKTLERSTERVTETSDHLIWAADRYAQAEAQGTQLVGDVFDVVEA